MNNKILITGANGFIGKTLVSFLKDKFDLVLVDRDFDHEFKNTTSKSINIQTYTCDFISEESRNVFIKSVLDNNKYLNAIINNAAFVGDSSLDGWNADFSEQSVNTFRDALEVNLISCFHLIRDFSRILVNSDKSSIINISSIYGTCAPKWNLYEDTSMNNPAAYGVSKSGLNYLTKWLASVLAPIKVNAISLGGISRNQPDNFIKKYEEMTPMRRMGKETDILSCVKFLLSEETNYVTGQNIFIDGGWSI